MRKKVIMITGASGEIGSALINNLAKQGKLPLLSLDLQPLPESEARMTTHILGDILDQALLSRLVSEYEIDTIYHLASSEWRGVYASLLDVDIRGTQAVVRAAADARVKRIFYLSHLGADRAGGMGRATHLCREGRAPSRTGRRAPDRRWLRERSSHSVA